MAKFVKSPPRLKDMKLRVDLRNALKEFPPGIYIVRATGNLINRPSFENKGYYRWYFEAIDEKRNIKTFFKMVSEDFEEIDKTIGLQSIKGELFEIEIDSFIPDDKNAEVNYVKSCTISDELRDKINRNKTKN